MILGGWSRIFDGMVNLHGATCDLRVSLSNLWCVREFGQIIYIHIARLWIAVDETEDCIGAIVMRVAFD